MGFSGFGSFLKVGLVFFKEGFVDFVVFWYFFKWVLVDLVVFFSGFSFFFV